MSWLKRHALTAAVVCLLIAFALWHFYPGVPAQWVFLGLGVVLLLLSLALNTGEARSAMGTRTARYGAGAAVMALLALGIVVAANAISLRHSVRWDFTENKRNSVSPQTIQVLRTLKAPVSAIAFFRSDTPGKKTAEDLLTQYATYSRGKFTWRLEDTDRAPALARQYGVESYGTVVLEGGPAGQVRTEKVQDAEEERLTNALVKITRAGKRVVYVLKGHGEREIGSTDRAGFSQAKEQMEKANYEVKDLFLARDPKIPDDAAIVMVPSPKTDLFPQELAALDGYIAKAGKVFLMAGPFQADTTMKYLTKYGIVVDEDVVIELNPIGQVFGVGPLVPVVGQYEPHPITKDMAGVMTLFPLTRSLAPAKALPKGVQASSLAQTSRQSWGETDKNVFQTGKATPDPNEKTGPLSVALVATVDAQPDPKAEGDAAKKAPKARIVVVGTADFASNQFLGAQGNRDFFLNVVSWLAEEEDLISIRAKDPKQNPVMLTSGQSRLVLGLPLLALPGAVLICGIAVILQRRRAR
ncbi:MAG TPA: GldG family protein [Candidatus Dormibacteraeota bacterium]|nr:GldG family protein [Candidatus Dormibacteraeota bacterium]